MKKISKVDLFLELAKPDETGNSRKVLVSEFVGKYERLQFGNGKYRGTCVGCYWHDIKKFNQEISKIKDDKGE